MGVCRPPPQLGRGPPHSGNFSEWISNSSIWLELHNCFTTMENQRRMQQSTGTSSLPRQCKRGTCSQISVIELLNKKSVRSGHPKNEPRVLQK